MAAMSRGSRSSRLAFHSAVDPNKNSGAARWRRSADIRFAHELGYVIKLLAAQVEGNDLHLRVGPTLVPERHPMALERGDTTRCRWSVWRRATPLPRQRGGAATASKCLPAYSIWRFKGTNSPFASLQLWD